MKYYSFRTKLRLSKNLVERSSKTKMNSHKICVYGLNDQQRHQCALMDRSSVVRKACEFKKCINERSIYHLFFIIIINVLFVSDASA